ncbi:hypothetical protein ABBQ32_011072 [Trebouxia sp. C0010 RCD-2024]
MASKALKELGEKAFQPLKVGDIWHKAAISAKSLAKLRRQTLAKGSEWQFDRDLPARPTGFLRKVKGHKHDKLAAARQEEIQKNLDGMAERIQKYRDSRKLKEASLLDQLLLTPKQLRLKQYRETK